MKRFIIEFGLGIDFHGQDVTKAAKKAVNDAISKSCLIGLSEVLEIKNFDENVQIKTTVAVSKPELVNIQEVAACFPVGKVFLNVVSGGLVVPGLYVPDFGDKNDSIEVAVVVVEVWVDV